MKRQPLDLTKGFAISGDLLHLMAKIMKKSRVDWLFRVFDPLSNEIVFEKRVVADLAAANSKSHGAPLARAEHSLLRVSRPLGRPAPAGGMKPLRRGLQPPRLSDLALRPPAYRHLIDRG